MDIRDPWCRQRGCQGSFLSPEYSRRCKWWNWKWIIGDITPISPWFSEAPPACGLVQISFYCFHPFHTGLPLEASYLPPSLSHLVDKQVLLSLVRSGETGKNSLQKDLGWPARGSSWNLFNQKQSFQAAPHGTLCFLWWRRATSFWILLTKNHFTEFRKEHRENVW